MTKDDALQLANYLVFTAREEAANNENCNVATKMEIDSFMKIGPDGDRTKQKFFRVQITIPYDED